jgi:hypothetical protein
MALIFCGRLAFFFELPTVRQINRDTFCMVGDRAGFAFNFSNYPTAVIP